MTICPIALAVHCVGCPLVKLCPAKKILGDFGKYTPTTAEGKQPGERPPEKKAP